MPSAGHDRFLLQFAPDQWSASTKLLKFLGPPFLVNRQTEEAIQSCIDHSRKYEVLASLANRIQPTLLDDVHELEQHGYTPARRSSEFAAVVETMVCELYSVLDGIRNSIFWLLPGCRGVQKKSTSQLFSRAALKSYGSEFPETIRLALAIANEDWFSGLRRFRTAFTHGGLGSCHIDKQTELVSYMNSSLGDAATTHTIPDFVTVVVTLAEAVFSLQNTIFDNLYSQLQPAASQQFCGIYKGRMYTRQVIPLIDLNRGSGVCTSRSWFAEEPEFWCPRSNSCEAFSRPVP